MELVINGEPREFSQLSEGAPLDELMAALELKADRVAVEYDGAIVSRGDWAQTPLRHGAKLEIVHFVGGGLARE